MPSIQVGPAVRTAIFCFFILFILFIATPKKLLAVSTIFADDFEDGVLNNWSLVFNSCKFNGSTANWIEQNGKLGIKINGGGCSTFLMPSSAFIDPGVNYFIESDITFSPSVNMDRNLIVKFKDLSNWYGMHFVGNDVYLDKVVNGTEYFLPDKHFTYSFQDGQEYHIRIEVIENEFKIYINDILEHAIIDQSPLFDHLTAGMAASAGGIPNSEVLFDNFKIGELVENLNQLGVPDIKQYQLPWKDDVYDHAQNWAGSQKLTMERWGCLITSLTMIAQYHGYNFTPQDLNNWLKLEEKAFTKKGALIIDKFTKYIRSLNSSPLPLLEYKRNSYATSLLSNEINSKRPAILKWEDNNRTSNHFLVATGIQNSDFLINDPASTKNLLSELPPQVVALDMFTPSNTDLSSLVLVVDTKYDIQVSSQNDSIEEIEKNIEYPLKNFSEEDIAFGSGELFVRIPKPKKETYQIKISGPEGVYSLSAYIFDEIANDNVYEVSGILSDLHDELVEITIGDYPSIAQVTTIDSLISDLYISRKNGLISNEKIYKLIKSELLLAKFFKSKSKLFAYRASLRVAIHHIKKFTPNQISSDVSKILQEAILSLL